MQFLNPKTDFTVRKTFSSETGRDTLINSLNAVPDLRGDEVIATVTVPEPPRLAPKIVGMKDTYLDVRVVGQTGHWQNRRNLIIRTRTFQYP